MGVLDSIRRILGGIRTHGRMHPAAKTYPTSPLAPCSRPAEQPGGRTISTACVRADAHRAD
jgi:hypothetical protein